MKFIITPFKVEGVLPLLITSLLLISIFILNSLSPQIFPQYYWYLIISIIAFYIFYYLSFDLLTYFSNYLYIVSIILLILTLVIGQVTRGAVRWIPFGSFSFQASEIVRPFLLIYFSNYIVNNIKDKRIIVKYFLLTIIPVLLIAVQPSFSVSGLTFLGIISILIVKKINFRNILLLLFSFLIIVPGVWFLLRPYQKDRITSFVKIENDPKGAGYNTIQSVISVGSGGLLGRGFRKGFQTQLKYLPEKHTDFVFAGISEELGFLGVFVLSLLLFLYIFRILAIASISKSENYSLFLIGSCVVFLFEIIINISMNLGIFPVTGLPLPFVSAGGSSLLSSMITTSLIISGKDNKHL